MLLKQGDIVTDLDPTSCFSGKQGRVEQIQLHLWADPEVTVRFDRDICSYHLGDDECMSGICDIYPPNLLRRDTDWEPEVYARRLFGKRWHSISTMKKPLDPDDPCLVEGCGAKQEKTAWFNIWGSVCNAHVCAEHAQAFHGFCGDSFPWRGRVSA